MPRLAISALALVVLAVVTPPGACRDLAPRRQRVHQHTHGAVTTASVDRPSHAWLTAFQPPVAMWKLPQLDKLVDTVLAGVGLAASFTLAGALEARLGTKLLIPPMMASGIIFFAGAEPPNPKGFFLGTTGCATMGATILSLLSGRVPDAAAQGAAAGALLMWYKATGCIFPPAAALCVLMSAQAAPLPWVAKTWVAGHAVLYASAFGVSVLRASARAAINKKRLRGLGGLTDGELRQTFNKFDTTKDGFIDESELRVALRVAVGVDLAMDECRRLIMAADKDGNGLASFQEFKQICLEQAK